MRRNDSARFRFPPRFRMRRSRSGRGHSVCGDVVRWRPLLRFARCIAFAVWSRKRNAGSARLGSAPTRTAHRATIASPLGASAPQLQRSALLLHRNRASRCNDAMCCNDARCRCPPRPPRSARCPPHRRAGLRDSVPREVERREVGDGRDRRNERRRRPARESPARSALTTGCVTGGAAAAGLRDYKRL